MHINVNMDVCRVCVYLCCHRLSENIAHEADDTWSCNPGQDTC